MTTLKELETYLKEKIRHQQVSIFHLESNVELSENTSMIAECGNEIGLLKGLLTMVQDKLDGNYIG